VKAVIIYENDLLILKKNLNYFKIKLRIQIILKWKMKKNIIKINTKYFVNLIHDSIYLNNKYF